MNTRLPVLAAATACCTLALSPAPASAQGGLLGTIGQVVTGTTGTVTQTLDDVLGGVTAILPADTLGDVLVTVTTPPGDGSGGGVVGGGVGGVGGAGGSGGSGAGAGPGGAVRIVGSSSQGGSSVLAGSTTSSADRSAPRASIRVLSRLSQVARTRKLRVQVRSDEAGVVGIASTIRPGLKRRGVKARGRHDRSVIHVPATMLAFRQAGALVVELKLTAADARRLGRSRNGRMSIGVLTADVARNQASERLKRHLAR